MQKVLTAEEMREVDRLTTEKYGIPSIILMENAAHAAARIITQKLGGSVKGKSFLFLCGQGNNGGDGAALARILWTRGADVDVCLFGKIGETKGDARTNFEIVKGLARGINWANYCESIVSFVEICDIDQWRRFTRANSSLILIDALLGTGLTRPIEKPLSQIFKSHFQLDDREFRDSIEFLVSLDISSGLHSDLTECIGQTVESDFTVTFTAPKLANVFPPASNFGGELHVVNIGSPQELIDNCPSQLFVAEKQDAQDWLRQTAFTSDSYKNKRGNAFLIVGSKNYTGAAVLAGNGAIQSGVGLVTVATSKSAVESVSERVLPEVMVRGVAETENGELSFAAFEAIRSLSEKADVLAIGSGLGSDEESTRKLVREMIEKRTNPVVIDADGLNSVSPFELQGTDEFPLVLTPHEGEFLRLLGTNNKHAIIDRVKVVRDFAVKHNVILVLKGERTLVAEPGGKVVINPTGNSGLGKAGNGDNLTGIIAGFIAQGAITDVGVFESVVAAVYISGLAGDIAMKKHGKRVMLASDVRECLAEAFRETED